MKLLIIPNIDKEDTLSGIKQLKEVVSEHNCKLLFHNVYKDAVGKLADFCSEDLDELLERCDAVITFGGDGTIIHAAKLAAEASRPTLGINLGHLGFTAGLEISELSLLSKLLTGDYITEKRMMLDVRVVGGDNEERLFCHAMNDAVISRGSLATIIDLEVFHNDRSAMSFRADGVIVSTPTGSTAYSLSAGGPVVDPMIQCIEVTPVCAHSLHTRPILFAPDSTIRIEASKNTDHALFGQMNDRGIFLSVDGEMVYSLQPDESVIIEKSDVYADFIIIKRQSFAEVLKQKFVGK